MYFFIIILLFLAFAYRHGTKTFDYWKRKGIKHDPPLPFFGTNVMRYFQRATQAMIATDVYRRYPEEKVVGFYYGRYPVLIVRDPDIVKRILVTDFQHFHSRGINILSDILKDPISKSILFVDGDVWHSQREIFSPAFTAAKIRSMFPLITEKIGKLQIFAEKVSKLEAYDVQELMGRFNTDVIGAYGFGLDMDCLSDEHSQYRILGKKITQRTLRQAFVFVAVTLFPCFFKNMFFFDAEISNTINYLVASVLKNRNYKISSRNDFLDIFLKLKENAAKVEENMTEQENRVNFPKNNIVKQDDSLVVAQMFLFFAAGFETSASSSSYTLHQLAFHPEYQEKVQKEIDTVLVQHNNKITYESLNEMKYLQMAFSESMRMNPSVGYLGRMCTSHEYTFPEINLTINQGVRVLIPIHALQNDKKYFEDPEIFKPDRFGTHKFQNKISNFVYMPFGKGPRSCIGPKLGQMQGLAGLAGILQKFTVEPASCTVRNPPPDPTSHFVEGYIGGLPLKLRKRNS